MVSNSLWCHIEVNICTGPFNTFINTKHLFTTMATFALVKLKRNCEVRTVPVKNVHSIVKIKGVKSFLQFQPADFQDFVVSSKFKYSVDLEDDDGNVRRWYAMIGCLGVSEEELLRHSNSLIWPEPRKKCKVVTVKMEQGNDLTMELYNEPVNTDNPPTCLPPQDEQMMNSHELDATQATTEHGTNSQEQGIPMSVVEQMQRDIVGELTKKFDLERQNMLQEEQNLLRRVVGIIDMIKKAHSTVVPRLTSLEALVKNLIAEINKGAHVCEWVKGLPPSIPNASEEVAEISSGMLGEQPEQAKVYKTMHRP